MGQPVESQSQFCITAILTEVSDLTREEDRRANEKLNRSKRQAIERVGQQVTQMEAPQWLISIER
jgi:hypothetical protein